MNLKDVLEKIELGEGDYNAKKLSEEVEKDFDEILENYQYSKLLKKLENDLFEDVSSKRYGSEIIPSLRKIRMKVESIEDKNYPTEIYKKMKTESVVENVNEINSLLERKEIKKSINLEKLASFIALTKKSLYELNEGEVELKRLSLFEESFEKEISDKLNKI
jgi:hypothetical protein